MWHRFNTLHKNHHTDRLDLVVMEGCGKVDIRDIVILANSRRHNGQCIAGKDLNTREWIRPINILGRGQSRIDQSAFLSTDFQKLVGDPSGPKVLDCVRISFGEKCGDYYQPENQFIDGNPWMRLPPFPRTDIPGLIDGPSTRFVGKDDHYSDNIPVREIKAKPLEHSLNFIRITRAFHKTEIIHTTSFRGNPQHRLCFEYESKPYNFVITDYAYEHLVAEQSHDDIQILKDCYVTIGVGEVFMPGTRSEELHYRLIVGIIPVSIKR